MDSTVVVAALAGSGTMLTALALLVSAVRRDSPENIKALHARAAAADLRAAAEAERADRERAGRLASERRADDVEVRLYATEALVHRLRLALAQHGILIPDVELTPPGGIPSQRQGSPGDTPEVPQP